MFERHKSDVGLSLTLTDVPAKAGESYVEGEALIISGGVATKASGDCDVAYICHENKEAKEGDMLRVSRVGAHEEYLTTLSVAGTSLKVGNAVTISTDGLEITATATTVAKGAEIVKILDSAKGGKVVVRLK